MGKPKKRKAKVKIKQSFHLAERNDATRVEKSDVFPRMRAQRPRTVAPVLKVKIKKKQ